MRDVMPACLSGDLEPSTFAEELQRSHLTAGASWELQPGSANEVCASVPGVVIGFVADNAFVTDIPASKLKRQTPPGLQKLWIEPLVDVASPL